MRRIKSDPEKRCSNCIFYFISGDCDSGFIQESLCDVCTPIQSNFCDTEKFYINIGEDKSERTPKA